MTFPDRRRLVLERWASIGFLAIVGVVVFEAVLPVAWRYVKSLPEPTTWFTGWFVYLAVLAALLALAYVIAEPLRFRTRHVRHLLWYPPLWFSVVLALGLAAALETSLRPWSATLVPEWRRIDVIGFLVIAAIFATALRQRPWKWSNPMSATPVLETSVTWNVLQEWFAKEEPLSGGRDLLGHLPIAERIVRAVNRPENQAIALIGPVGSGKSSVLNMVKARLNGPNSPLTILAEFNCWAMPRPEDAPRIALEQVIDALDNVVDAQAVRRLPVSYQRVLAAEPTGRLTKLLGLDDAPDAADQLRRLTPLLTAIDARLVLIIEDAERAGRDFETRHLERLLWTLRKVDRVSFVLSFDTGGVGFDYGKLCDTIERIPLLTVERVEELLAPAYEAWGKVGDNFIDPIYGEERKDRLGLTNVTEPAIRYLRRTQGESVSDAIVALLATPRNLKHFIRDVDRTWANLRGEVELNDLIVLTALRHGAPAVFDFIVENAEPARSDRKELDDTFAGGSVKTVKARWETLRNSLPAPTQVQSLVDILDLPQLSSDTTISSQSSPQGIHNGEAVDYLGRILAGELLPGEIRDQDVIHDIEAWKGDRSRQMVERLESATERSDHYVRVWEHYAGRLSWEELIEVAGVLIDGILTRRSANASIKHPAMLATWRRANRRMERDTKTDWLIRKIESVLPTSLGFATDLFQYWASVSHGIVGVANRARVRAALVAQAQASLGSADKLLAALGPEHEYPLTRLIYPPPTDEPPDTIPSNSWAWLVELIFDAAKLDEERILPDVAIFVGDTSHGFRTGKFEERYKLRRDWMKEIFGARTDQMLKLLAAYGGSNQYAMDAKREAEAWLKERASAS
jgi:hypothetical protein